MQLLRLGRVTALFLLEFIVEAIFTEIWISFASRISYYLDFIGPEERHKAASHVSPTGMVNSISSRRNAARVTSKLEPQTDCMLFAMSELDPFVLSMFLLPSAVLVTNPSTA